MTDNEMIASLAAFFLEEFGEDAPMVAEAMEMSDEELRQLIKFCEEKAPL